MPKLRKSTRFCDLPVFELVMNMQLTGNGPKRLSQIDIEVLEEASTEFDLEGVPEIISELDEYSIDPTSEEDRCLELVKDVYSRLTNFEARRTRDDNGEDEQTKYSKLFLEYGGVEVLLRMLMQTAVLPEESYDMHDTENLLRLKSIILEILNRIISTKRGEDLAKRLASNDDILVYVFTLLAHDKTYLTACQFIEDLLQARRSVLNLASVYNLRALIMSLDDRKLASFCRVLAITISDLDIYENKSSLFAQHKQKSSKGFVNVRDINQELLLNIPDMLARLVRVSIATDYTPRFMGMNSELDCWMEWIENSMTSDNFELPNQDDFDDFIGGISQAATFGGPMVQQSGLRISTDLIQRVQVVYVLGLFLVGKHRKKVQRKLAELNLIPGLSELFDKFIWKCQAHRNNTRHRLRGHNASCECSPEVALKIQFLRLVHSFCDHSEHKHLLLTKSELAEVKRINNKADAMLQVDYLDKVNKSLMCRGSRGLLTKVVDVMKKEPTASTFRFWLARAVESYLRGGSSHCDQVFLLRKGLLEHIAGNIVDNDIRPKEILQSSFDLLGELVKFNLEAFENFDKLLSSEDRVNKFVETVDRNLVDSNMFIRALILSLEHFTNQQPQHEYYAVHNSVLLRRMARFDKQIMYLRKFINLINVQNLTQENVSCLNTTLVFLMFANQKKIMPQYLRALMLDTTTSGVECINLSIIKNFRDLLMFWQDHYLHKDKDCSALEKSSRISFDYWKETVNTLVEENRDSELAILHYLDSDTGRNS